MTGPGRPPIGPVREVRIPDELWDAVLAESFVESVSMSEVVRRALAERYEGKGK
jgi:hypothetical protein